MVSFGFDEFKTEQEDWAKHYPQIANLYKREYHNDKEDEITDDKSLLNVAERHPERIETKNVTIFQQDTKEKYTATSYYFLLDNLDVVEADVNYYHVGMTNSSQKTKMRFMFKLGTEDFRLDYHYESEGPHASNFYDMIRDEGIEDMLWEVAENNQPFIKKGIRKGEDEDFHIVALDEMKVPLEFEINADELLQNLIGIEVYDHKTKVEHWSE